jgi:hypothetical protein
MRDEEVKIPKVTEREDVKSFLGEVFSTDTLTFVIRAHLYAESKLIRLLSDSLPNPRALDIERMSFSRKVDLAHALTLVDETTRRTLTLLNKLRNRFAHNLKSEISDNDLSTFVECLGSRTSEAELEREAIKATEAIRKLKLKEIDIRSIKMRICLTIADASLLAVVETVSIAKQRGLKKIPTIFRNTP